MLPPDRNSYIVVIGISSVGIALALFVVIAVLVTHGLTPPQRLALVGFMAIAVPIYLAFLIASIRRLRRLGSAKEDRGLGA